MATQFNENTSYRGPVADNESSLAEKAQETASSLASKAQEMTSSLTKQAHEMTGTLAEQASEAEQLMRAKLTDYEEQARVFIRQQPMMAVLGAVGLGYLMARMVSREARRSS